MSEHYTTNLDLAFKLVELEAGAPGSKVVANAKHELFLGGDVQVTCPIDAYDDAK